MSQTNLVPNKPRIKAWVEALRSGKYKQGRNCLKSTEGYCCLGVGCEISRLGEWVEDPTYTKELIGGTYRLYRYVTGDEKRMGCMGKKVEEFYGFSNYIHLTTTNENNQQVTHSLSWYNDNGTPFSEIADIIEKNFLT